MGSPNATHIVVNFPAYGSPILDPVRTASDVYDITVPVHYRFLRVNKVGKFIRLDPLHFAEISAPIVSTVIPVCRIRQIFIVIMNLRTYLIFLRYVVSGEAVAVYFKDGGISPSVEDADNSGSIASEAIVEPSAVIGIPQYLLDLVYMLRPGQNNVVQITAGHPFLQVPRHAEAFALRESRGQCMSRHLNQTKPPVVGAGPRNLSPGYGVYTGTAERGYAQVVESGSEGVSRAEAAAVRSVAQGKDFPAVRSALVIPVFPCNGSAVYSRRTRRDC